MNYNIVNFLLITFYVRDIVAENCEVLTATDEAQSFVIKNNITDCQYRVQSNSGKPLKVFVNATSGTDCVKVTSGDKSETLCSTGTTTEFKSSSAIDVSADSVTTTTTTATATITTTPTTAPTPPSSEETKDKNNKEVPSPGTAENASAKAEKEPQPAGEKEVKMSAEERALEENLQKHGTSGTKCVTVTSDGKTETLCPSSAKNQFTSDSSIEVSASSEATTRKPTEATTEPTTKPTEQSPPEEPSDSEQQQSPKHPNSPRAEANVQQSQASKTSAQQDGQGKQNPEDEGSKEQKSSLKAALLRKARDNSETAGSNDVTVYYVLDECYIAANVPHVRKTNKCFEVCFKVFPAVFKLH
ncbi:unnamed protein product [Echinostoma caproni]|uniref:Uncharacterized protein n=1 Tax=Echinostoma caproni TaxID=27848 RepID=A0A183A592_9TREM|nr:unnamed protein product [Echinostoma caproni]